MSLGSAGPISSLRCTRQALGPVAFSFLSPGEEGLSLDPILCQTGPDQGSPDQLQTRVGTTDQPLGLRYIVASPGSLGLGALTQL